MKQSHRSFEAPRFLATWILCATTILAAGTARAIVDPHTEIKAKYNFTYNTNALPGDPAGPPSELNNSPYYTFDGTNSGFTSSPTLLFGPRAKDLSTNNYDLFHERIFTGFSLPSGNTPARWVTSITNNGGSGAQGVYMEVGGPVPMSAHQFTVGDFARGFTIDLHIEVDRTTAPSLDSTIVRLPGIFLSMASGTGEATATIEGTFGNAVKGTTPLLKTGASRPDFDVKLVYLPELGTSTDNLFLYVNDVLEDSKIAFGITAANGVSLPLNSSGPLSVLGNGNFSRVLTGVVLEDLTILVPEPSTVSLLALAGLVLLRRRFHP